MGAAAGSTGHVSRWARVKGGLTPGQWRTVAAMFAVIAALHAVGFVLLFVVVAPRDFALGDSGVFAVGLGLTAYTLGLRHAFDADHIARDRQHDAQAHGRRPAAGQRRVLLLPRALDDRVRARRGVRPRRPRAERRGERRRLVAAPGHRADRADASRARSCTIIGLLNLLVLVGIVGVFRRMRQGEYDEAELEEQLNNRGLMNRIYRRATNTVKKPWQMYPRRPAVRARVRHRDRGRAAGRWPARPPRADCRSTRSCACRSSSPPGCRCSTRSTARS